MPELAVSRKQRLTALEDEIRRNFEAFVATGFALKEIRYDHLYEEAGFATWEQYLRQRVRVEFQVDERQARKLILCAQVREKLPDRIGIAIPINGGGEKWSQRDLLELARLAPRKEEAGQPYDIDRLNSRDVARVVRKVDEHCAKEGVCRTSALVQKFVDEDLGIDRKAQAKEAKQKREEEREEQRQEGERRVYERTHPELGQFLYEMASGLNEDVAKLQTVEPETWRHLDKSEHSDEWAGGWTIDYLLEASRALADLLAKVAEIRASKSRKRIT
jgi:hypothetical protein